MGRKKRDKMDEQDLLCDEDIDHSQKAPKSPDNFTKKRKLVDYEVKGGANVASLPKKLATNMIKERTQRGRSKSNLRTATKAKNVSKF